MQYARRSLEHYAKRGQFQKLFCENCDDSNAPTKTLTVQGKKVFETIWGNVELRINLWNPADYPNGVTVAQAQNIFSTWVSQLDGKIFNFIKSR